MNKVLCIVPLPPPVHGSSMVSQYVKDSDIIKEKFDLDFVNLSTSRTMAEIGKNGPVLLVKKLWRFTCSYLRCLWLLMANRYDLCYCAITCHAGGFLKDAPFVLLCKLFGRKVALHQHNKGMSECIDKWPYRWCIPFVYKNCKVILLSWRLYPDVEKVVKKENVLICPNGIPPLSDTANFEGEANTAPKLLYLSNLIISKGVYVLLDACKLMQDRGLDFSCDFIGGDSKEISIADFERAISDKGLGEKVHYLGRKYGDEKFAAYRQCDVFVLPTMNDCLPLTIIEAMQQSKPVVSTDIGAVADLVKHMVTGLIVETDNAEDLADKLQQLVLDKELREHLGDNALLEYNEKYSLSAFETRLCDCLLAVLQ